MNQALIENTEEMQAGIYISFPGIYNTEYGRIPNTRYFNFD